PPVHDRVLARTIHEYLLRRPILSRGCPLLFKLQWAMGFSRRTDDPLHSEEQRVPRTPASSSLARSPGGLRSQPPRYGIHGIVRDRLRHAFVPKQGGFVHALVGLFGKAAMAGAEL